MPGLGLMILVSVFVLAAALVLNVIEDRGLDAKARDAAMAMRSKTTRCANCGTALVFDRVAMRWFCPSCRTYVGPILAPLAGQPPSPVPNPFSGP